MDAIKKKMQAMKLEKENALDKAEQLEQKLRDVEETKAKVSAIFFCVFCLFYLRHKYTVQVKYCLA
jgi:hypothetical protein